MTGSNSRLTAIPEEFAAEMSTIARKALQLEPYATITGSIMEDGMCARLSLIDFHQHYC